MDLCARHRYYGQERVITSHSICGMWSLVPALDTLIHKSSYDREDDVKDGEEYDDDHCWSAPPPQKKKKKKKKKFALVFTAADIHNKRFLENKTMPWNTSRQEYEKRFQVAMFLTNIEAFLKDEFNISSSKHHGRKLMLSTINLHHNYTNVLPSQFTTGILTDVIQNCLDRSTNTILLYWLWYHLHEFEWHILVNIII